MNATERQQLCGKLSSNWTNGMRQIGLTNIDVLEEEYIGDKVFVFYTKSYILNGSVALGIIHRTEYYDGKYRGFAFEGMTRGNGWSDMVGTTLSDVIKTCLNLNFIVCEFKDFQHFMKVETGQIKRIEFKKEYA